MSKKNNVNPDHYKTAGRERPGEDIAHDAYKRWYMQSRTAADAHAHVRNFIPGAQDQERAYEQIKPEAGRPIVEARRKGGGK
jgi:hypothetical protein